MQKKKKTNRDGGGLVQDAYTKNPKKKMIEVWCAMVRVHGGAGWFSSWWLRQCTSRKGRRTERGKIGR